MISPVVPPRHRNYTKIANACAAILFNKKTRVVISSRLSGFPTTRR